MCLEQQHFLQCCFNDDDADDKKLMNMIVIKYRKAISRLRLRSNRLQIVRGSYSKIPECDITRSR